MQSVLHKNKSLVKTVDRCNLRYLTEIDFVRFILSKLTCSKMQCNYCTTDITSTAQQLKPLRHATRFL